MHTGIPKTAIIGSSGFLGRHFLPVYRRIHPDCIATVKENFDESRGIHHFNLNSPDISRLQLEKKQHKEAFIFASVTRVNICEEEKIKARKANVDGILELIRQLVEEGIKPIFFSSAYVFDGKKGGYRDNASTNPVIEYGKQKAEVEARIADVSKGKFLVIRLCKIFSRDKEDNTFLDEIAHILVSGGIYRAAYDQLLSPTLVDDVIEAVGLLQTVGANGIVNVCSPEMWSRYDLAVALAKLMGIGTDRVKRVALDEVMASSGYPKNTTMMSSEILKPFRNFTPMSACLAHAANNWKAHAGRTVVENTVR